MIDSTAMRPTASDRTRKLIATARALTLAMALSFGAFTAAHAEPATIVAIGADNVNGKGKGKSYPGGVGRSDAFPAQLETLLRAQQIDARVVNEGMAGDTTAGILSRLDRAVPDGTKLVILDIARGNDTRAGGKDGESDTLDGIKNRLDARHIALFVLPDWRDIPDLMANRDPDGHHFTAQGHAAIAAYLLPKVTAVLNGQPPEALAVRQPDPSSQAADPASAPDEPRERGRRRERRGE